MSEQFCLRWNNHQSTLISVFETLLESGSLIDCTLCAEGQLLKGHKVVLSACSPIFESMLCVQEDKHPIIFLRDVKFIELKAMLDYMYKGEVNILQDQLDSFLRTAAALQIKGLTDQGGGGGDEPPAKKGPGRKTGMSDVAPESPLVGNAPLREGSVSPTRRRRRLPRRPSSAEDASADNSCDIPPPAVAPPAITPATQTPTHTPLPVAEPLHRQTVKAAKQEPIDPPLVPKQEYVEETNEEIEDLTLDDDDDYNDSMSDMSKPGTSFMNPGSTSQQDFSQWQQMMGAADRSGTDEVFMAAQEAINNQTNTQGKERKKDDEGLTSLIVEIDEHDKTKRIYWVKNEDLSTEIHSADEKIPEETPKAQVDNDDDTFDVTAPMKHHKETTDDDYLPSSSEEDEQQVKRMKSVGQIVRRTSLEEEGLELKITGVTTLGTKPKGGRRFTDENGYVYYQHSTTAFKRQLKCVFANVAKFKCQAKASMALDPPDSPIVLSSKSVPHNHPPENEKTLASKFAKRLKERVLKEPNVSVKEIYEDECKKCPLSAKVLPENIALQRMRRCRRVYNRSINGEPERPELPSDDEDPGASTELQMSSEGKIIYIDAKGYQYHQQYSSAHKRQLRCTKARTQKGVRCPARASMPLRPRYAPIKMTKKGHNHPPASVDHSLFYYNLKKKAKHKDTSLRMIYEEEAKRNPELAAAVPFNKVKQAMQRARRNAEGRNTSLDVGITTENRTPAQKERVTASNSNQSAVSPCTVGSSRPSVSYDTTPVSNRRRLDSNDDPVSDSHPAVSYDSAVSNRCESNDDAPVSPVSAATGESVSAHVGLQDIFIGPGQKIAESKIFYECPNCGRLFDNEDPLDQHILDEHVNNLAIEEVVWDDSGNVSEM